MEFFNGDVTPKKVLLSICVVLGALMVVKIILSLLPLAVILFVLLGPPIYVLADAQERKAPRPVLWAIFTMFTSIFGLMVYLLARPDSKTKLFCSQCGGEVDQAFKNCPWCGNAVQGIGKCHQCEIEVKPGWKFCPNCRSALGTPAPTSGATPA